MEVKKNGKMSEEEEERSRNGGGTEEEESYSYRRGLNCIVILLVADRQKSMTVCF